MRAVSSRESSQQPRPGGLTDPLHMWVLFACLAAIGAGYALGYQHYSVPETLFLPLHLMLEFTSIVVCFAVFTTGWFGFRQTRNTRDFVIGITFLATGIFDFVHTLSYRGMPDFLGANSVGGAAAFWLCGRLTAGLGLLAASFVRNAPTERRLRPWLLAAGALLAVFATVALIVVNVPAVAGAMYSDEHRSLTPLKNGLEYLAIAIYIAGFLATSERFGWERNTARLLRSALLVAALAEFPFTAYAGPYDWINALGHLLKAVSYLFILSALFASAFYRPYRELSAARDELQGLYADAQEQRREIEESFARIGSALSSSLNLDQALDRISELAGDMLRADCAIVALLDTGNGEHARVAAQRGGCHHALRPMDLAVRVGQQAIAEQRPVLINDLESTGWVDCALDEPTCLRSMICAPMLHDSHALGVVAVFSHSPLTFHDGDPELLEGFAAHASVAVQNALSYERESRIADVLQHAFLSRPDIDSGRFDIAEFYKPAYNESLVGGDFYDVIYVKGSKVGLAIGDVSGKGLAAAVHTAMAKYSLRAYVDEGHGPADALRLVNSAITNFTEPETFITMFFGLLDLETGELVYANGGHEPPIYASGGSYRELSSTGPALGMGIDLGYQEETIVLEPGSILLLYTDGVSEARKGSSLLGTERIGEELLVCDNLGSRDIANCVHQAALDFAGGELRDDAAILAVRALA